MSIRPADVVTALAAHLSARPWTYATLARELCQSKSQVHGAMIRAAAAGLWSSERRELRILEFVEFAAHGLRYVAPVDLGEITTGIPTAWSAEPLASLVARSEDAVWPDPCGAASGRAVVPLDHRVPQIVAGNRDLHMALALIDALRTGGARIRGVAKPELERLLVEHAPPPAWMDVMRTAAQQSR